MKHKAKKKLSAKQEASLKKVHVKNRKHPPRPKSTHVAGTKRNVSEKMQAHLDKLHSANKKRGKLKVPKGYVNVRKACDITACTLRQFQELLQKTKIKTKKSQKIVYYHLASLRKIEIKLNVNIKKPVDEKPLIKLFNESMYERPGIPVRAGDMPSELPLWCKDIPKGALINVVSQFDKSCLNS